MKLENVPFLTVEDVEAIHEKVLAPGELPGILNKNLLASAVEAARATFDGRPLYASVADSAAVYAWGIARNHPFADGNKRTALLAAWTFLDANGHKIKLDDSWVELMVRVASESGFERAELVRVFVAQMDSNEVIE